ncbi:glycine C-acetyltransferase [Gemmatimonas phototrophica]|uniref:2-amino-3-ketobutyrate CoA ligase n=1 Tax=Gemmatimonas phototrophica TaxID=1379270 RepID=A0A143BIF0_9BACT|nr:glycine C-acetyltransferase [Gemmatimonas phototrophica]AMW04240.1 2-amino-3-ketobutyrate CoA ligase [Gemmatimonas phototrophica]
MSLTQELQAELDALKAAGTYKRLNYIEGPQGARVHMEGRGEVIVLSSNNYLGLANEPSVVEAGVRALHQFGAGTASVRFICGTFTVHRDLEAAIARFVGTEASMSYVSAWNANEALTPTIAREGDFVISDALNHASIIDSVRLAKAMTKCTTAVYKHADMDDLREKLRANKDAKRKIIWTDGVFSMEGAIAKLPDILQIAREEGAIVVMDDSHATGVLGKTGRGTAEHFGVMGEVDIITSTLGKALGGAAGGFIAGSAALCDTMTQRSRPQLFSNALPPTVAASALAAVEFTESHPELVTRLHENSRYFRAAIQEAGFNPLPGETPIVPIIVGETALAIRMSDLMLERGVFVTGFGFPVVPKGEARVRCQVSAAHTRDDLDAVVAAFKDAGKVAGLL